MKTNIRFLSYFFLGREMIRTQVVKKNKTHFIFFFFFFFFRKWYRLWRNMEKHSRAGQPTWPNAHALSHAVGKSSRGQLKCDGTRTETRFRLSAKQTSPFKSAGASVHSTTGSRGVRFSGSNGSNAGYTMFRGSVKGIGYPLHSPVFPPVSFPCDTVCHHISTEVYCFSVSTWLHERSLVWCYTCIACLVLILSKF
jgi:hypothetical protein